MKTLIPELVFVVNLIPDSRKDTADPDLTCCDSRPLQAFGP